MTTEFTATVLKIAWQIKQEEAVIYGNRDDLTACLHYAFSSNYGELDRFSVKFKLLLSYN